MFVRQGEDASEESKKQNVSNYSYEDCYNVKIYTTI